MNGLLDLDECMAVARRAAAGVHRLIPELAPYRDDVTQNAYLAMLLAIRDFDPAKGDMYVFIYVCCRRSIILGWIWRNDYRFRRVHKLELTDRLPELGISERPLDSIILQELISAAKLSDLETATLDDYFWNGMDPREMGEHLGYTAAWARDAKNRAIDKLRGVMGMSPLPRDGQRRELSMTRGARSMRKRARENAA